MEHTFESVYTITDYYDGPQKGIADYNGKPHYYECVFDEGRDEYSDLFKLSPIDMDTLELAKEDWEIWRRWELAFQDGRTTRETHPALPEDAARHDELENILKEKLTIDSESCIILKAEFKNLDADIPLVRWLTKKNEPTDQP